MSRLTSYIIITIGVLLIILLLIFLRILPGRKPPSHEPVTLEFWGIEDEEEVWKDTIAGFHKKNPHISVVYRRLGRDSFERELINRLAEGKGPDLFMLESRSLEPHLAKIAPLPQERLSYTLRNFEKTFVDAARTDLVGTNGEIIGIPMAVNTLALFYNKDHFNAAGIADMPSDWDRLVEVSRLLTKKSSIGEISRSGMALGTFNNIEPAFEIVSSVIFQNGNQIINRATRIPELDRPAEEAFSFYVSFANQRNQNFSWTSRLPDAFDAFANGFVSMVFGFSQDALRVSRKNPHLNFGVLPFPQLRNARTSRVYGELAFLTVSRLSRHQDAAWQFILFAASRDGTRRYAGHTRKTPVRRDLIATGIPDETLEAFYKQSLIAQSWPIPDYEKTRRFFAETSDAFLTGSIRPDQAIERLEGQLKFLIP